MVTGVRNDQVFDIIACPTRHLHVSFSQFRRHNPVVFRADQDLAQAERQQFGW